MYILKTLKLNGLFDIETDTNSTEKNDIPNSSYDAINKHMNNTTNNATSLFTVTRDMNMIRAFGSSRLDLSEKKFNIIQIDVFYEKSTEKKLINKCYALKSPNLDENEISGVESSDNNVYIFTSFLDSDVYFLNISYSQVNEYFKKSAVQMNQSIEAFDVSYIFSTMTGLPLSFSTRGNLGVNLNKKEKVADHICEFNPYETIDINTWIDIDSSISLQLFKEKIKINHGQYINIPYYKNENF